MNQWKPKDQQERHFALKQLQFDAVQPTFHSHKPSRPVSDPRKYTTKKKKKRTRRAKRHSPNVSRSPPPKKNWAKRIKAQRFKMPSIKKKKPDFAEHEFVVHDSFAIGWTASHIRFLIFSRHFSEVFVHSGLLPWWHFTKTSMTEANMLLSC